LSTPPQVNCLLTPDGVLALASLAYAKVDVVVVFHVGDGGAIPFKSGLHATGEALAFFGVGNGVNGGLSKLHGVVLLLLMYTL